MMSKNWAIVVGINQYNPNNCTPLKYARQDAELMRNFFHKVGFKEVCFFSDAFGELTLSSGKTILTQATYVNLLSFLNDRFEKPFLSTGDTCWFFFAGHGERHKGQDFLLLQDSNPRAEMLTAIPLSYVRQRLCRSGAGNVILILDACRSDGGRSSMGIGNEAQQGVITISACSPTQKSWEIDELQHGVFTYALHEALSMSVQLNCTTVEKLNQFLTYRVPQLCQHYGKIPEQNPYVVPEPIEKSHLILLPEYVRSTGEIIPQTDIEALKKIVQQTFFDNKLDLAEFLCIQAIAASMGQDSELLKIYSRLQQSRTETPSIRRTSANVQTSARSLSQNQQSVQHSQAKQITSLSLKDDLTSDKGIDYRDLRDLLYRGEWKQADRQTSTILCNIANRISDRWLRVNDVALLPKQDLATINQLWTKYSNGKFGFGVQKQIWKACGSPKSYGEAWNNFGGAIGWYKDGQPNRYGYSLNPNDAPRGHFPRDFAFSALDGGTARGKEKFPISLTAKLLSRTF